MIKLENITKVFKSKDKIRVVPFIILMMCMVPLTSIVAGISIGAIGAGGLGNFAIMYGHQRNMPDIVYTTVLILLIMVTVLQVLGNYIASKYTH